MSAILIKLVVNALAVLIAARLLEGVTVKNFWHALLTAAVLALVNTFIKPIIMFFSFPFILLTLGLFILVVNAIMLVIVDWFVSGLRIKSFWWAMLFAMVLSVINWVMQILLKI